MRNDFTSIREALATLSQTIVTMHNETLARANAERQELISLYARMKDTQGDLDELASMAGEAAKELAAVDEVASAHAVLIEDAIYGGAEVVPTCDYEDFVGFCDECGGSVDARTDYCKEKGVLMCADCHGFYTKMEELCDETDETVDETTDTDTADTTDVETDEIAN